MEPWTKLAWATLGLLVLLKLVGVWIRRDLPWRRGGTVLFLLFWPGVDPRPFMKQAPSQEVSAEAFAGGLRRLLVGSAAVIAVALLAPRLGFEATTWIGTLALLLAVHMGLCVMVPPIYHLAGWPVPELFDRPWAAPRLIDFWSKHWNLAYVEMSRFLLLPLFRRSFGRRASIYVLLLASGILHELAISFPAGTCYGLPTLYFVIQALGIALERRLKWRSRLFAYAMFLLPLPILFHRPFRETCVEPLFTAIRETVLAVPAGVWLEWGIVALGVLQLAVLGASLQVPARLRWREELPRLSRLNERLVWTYGAFILLTIVALGLMTFALRAELLEGHRAARAVALFACVFWGLRLAFDGFWIRKEDWPKGPAFQIGHALLSTLFLSLFVGYGYLALRP